MIMSDGKTPKTKRAPKKTEKPAKVEKPANKYENKILVEKIREVMRKKGENLHNLSDKMGISYIHMTFMMSGARNFLGLDMDKQRALADYIGVSFSQFYIYAGVLKPEDFYSKETFGSRADLTFNKMRSDPMWEALVPAKDVLDKTPDESRLLMVLLYEKLSNEMLLDKTEVLRHGKDNKPKARAKASS